MATRSSRKNLVDLIREESKRGGVASALSRFVLLREPGSVKLRFLDDLSGAEDDQAYHYYVHTIRSGQFKRMLCAQQFGERCSFCVSGLPRKMTVAFRVFDYQEKTVKLIELRPGSSAMEDLLNYYEEHGTITDADFVYKRVGVGLNTRYSLILKDKGRFKFRKTAKQTWISREELVDIVKRRYALGEEQGESESE